MTATGLVDLVERGAYGFRRRPADRARLRRLSPFRVRRRVRSSTGRARRWCAGRRPAAWSGARAVATRPRDAAADLLLGRSLRGLPRAGRGAVPGLPRGAAAAPGRPARPTRCRAGSAPSYAVGPYDGLLRDLVLGHKERGLVGLRPVLGDLLALGGRRRRPTRPSGAVGVDDRCCSWCRCRRGVRACAAAGATRLRDLTRRRRAVVGSRVRRAGRRWWRPVLRSRPGVVDQAGLGAVGARANLAGSMAVRPRALRRLAAAGRRGARGGVRRRADDREHRPRGAARPRGGRGAGARGRHRAPRPGDAVTGARLAGEFTAKVQRVSLSQRPRAPLTSVHGVRPGPWLRRPPRGGRLADASRRRSGPRKSMPRGIALRAPSWVVDDHGAA